jgi:hypothetical protein
MLPLLLPPELLEVPDELPVEPPPSSPLPLLLDVVTLPSGPGISKPELPRPLLAQPDVHAKSTSKPQPTIVAIVTENRRMSASARLETTGYESLETAVLQIGQTSVITAGCGTLPPPRVLELPERTPSVTRGR